MPNPEKLITHPEKPLCGGAMHSPGFFPKGYICKPYNYGYSLVQALGVRHGFDPAATPWNEMTLEAQHAFLFGDPEPLTYTHQRRNGQTHTGTQVYPGFYGWVRDWDVGGTYTDAQACPACAGARLRPEYLTVTLGGQDIHALSEMALARLHQVLQDVVLAGISGITAEIVRPSLRTVLKRLRFLDQAGWPAGQRSDLPHRATR